MSDYRASGMSPAFVGYTARLFKQLRQRLTEAGCTNIRLSRQFYYWSGTFTAPSGQMYNIFSLDWRTPSERTRWVIRTIQHDKDFTGGPNHWVSDIDQIINHIK